MKRPRRRRAWRRRLPTLALLVGGLAAWGCDGEPGTETSSGTSTGGSGGSSTAPTGGTGAGGADAVPLECTSPSGYQVCGGPNDCPEDGLTCPSCSKPEDADGAGLLGLCYNDVYEQYMQAADHLMCGFCSDGDICFDESNFGIGAFCAPFELGPLIEQNGAAERLRYADHARWTGEPLPEPDGCLTLADVPTCGGSCGACASGDLCTGRSPLHPHGLCIPSASVEFGMCHATRPCDPGLGCFRWKVQPEAQAEADTFGYCLPLATCKAAAANLPGGGLCDAP